MNQKIWINPKDGDLYYIEDCPVEPGRILFELASDYMFACDRYKEVLSKAKQDAVRFADQKESLTAIFGYPKCLPLDSIHDLPSKVEVEVRDECQYKQVDGNCDDCFRGNLCAKLAYIKSKPEEETQEDHREWDTALTDAIVETDGKIQPYFKILSFLSEKYRLIRR
jgi:hypothetical protein